MPAGIAEGLEEGTSHQHPRLHRQQRIPHWMRAVTTADTSATDGDTRGVIAGVTQPTEMTGWIQLPNHTLPVPHLSPGIYEKTLGEGSM